MFNNDFKEFIQLLNVREVRYLVVGGYAVAVHGHPRYTKDLDIWLDISENNITKILTVLKDFGFESLNLNENDFTALDQVIQLGYPPNRIDLITQADGIDFESSYQNRMIINIDNLPINFISLEQLKINKKTTGRYQDLADLEALG